MFFSFIFSLVPSTSLQLSFELTPPACHSFSQTHTHTLAVRCYPPSHGSCVAGEESQAQGLKSQEWGAEFVSLMPILVGNNCLSKGFFFVDSHEFS